MPTQILAKGLTAANSTEITVVAGTPQTVGLFRADGLFPEEFMECPIMRKDPDTVLNPTGMTLSRDEPNIVLIGPGIYVVSRPVCLVATGVQID